MRIQKAVALALVGATLALAATAQIPNGNPTGAAAGKGPQMAYVLDANNQTGLLLAVAGLPNAAPSTTGAAKAPAGPAVGTSIPASLMLVAGVGMPRAFYQWLATNINTQATPALFAIAGAELSGRYGQATIFSGAIVSYVEIPTLDTGSNAPVALGVKTTGTLKIEPAGQAPTVQQVTQLATRFGAIRWPVSGFHLTVGNLDTS